MTNLILLDDPAHVAGSTQLALLGVNASDDESPHQGVRKLKQWAIDQNANNAALLAALPAVTSRLGQVATGTHLPAVPSTTNKQAMGRNGHYARDTLSTFQLVFPNFYVNTASGGAETAIGSNPATITCGIEYPVGTFTQVTFSGAAAGSIPAGGMLISDPISVPIPSGALFFSRPYFTNPDGIALFNVGMGTGLLDGASGIADLSVTAGTITAGNFAYGPCAIVAMTNKPSAGLIGDSRLIGLGETFSSTVYLRGHIERMLGSSLPFLSFAESGDRVNWFVASHTNRLSLLQYVTHIICNYGINDIVSGGRTAAQVHADLQTMFALTNIAGKNVYQISLEPISTSTDAWATETNQATTATNGTRNTFNTTLRAGVANVTQVFDFDLGYEESFVTNGIFQAPGGTGSPPPSAAVTNDGEHLNTYGTLRLLNAAAPIGSLFAR